MTIMEIASKYDPALTEDKWYKYWMDMGFFKSVPDDREPYTIVIPPPNVTGVLHMGHMLNNTIQDILIRRARMMGKNALWIPGTDHASIATEARVVAKLKEEGISKTDLTRDEFLKYAWIWKEKHGGIILEQLKKLGASCDWSRTRFTMDDDYYDSVIDVFIDLYNKGKIYRGIRMVNWDPQAKTAVSDEEVNYVEEDSKLYYVKYAIEGTTDWITIATTRPETILGDTAVCVNPNDERYTKLIGKKVIVPMVNRSVPLISDAYVDMEFGTGALKITPAHDINDYEIGLRHHLDSIDIFNNDGTLSEKAGLFIGIDRFEARRLSVQLLEEKGHLVKTEGHLNKIGRSERTNAVIEPKLSVQWFVDMKDLAKPALECVMSDEVQLYPPKYKNTYKHWMENVKDWCISRQLWWGQRIPAYYLPDSNDFVVAKTLEKALELAIEKTGNKALTICDLCQDEDVMDTWFSSWLWPISVFGNVMEPEKSKDLSYYYPTNDLVTAPEILFFWVARMIIVGYEYKGEKPFRNVYLTGIVRDQQRRKMSKSLGNSPDPLELIAKYGADGVRVGMLLCSPAGGDLLFDESLTEQGRNFGNKIWNAYRLIMNWVVDQNLPQPEYAASAIGWFTEKLNQTIAQIDDHYSKYRLSDALMSTYRLFWQEFSSWYLEAIKPAYQHAIDAKTIETTLSFLDSLLKLLHPFMPFITEEIWQTMKTRKAGESIMISYMPEAGSFDEKRIEAFEDAKLIITAVRSVRKTKNLDAREELALYEKSARGVPCADYSAVIKKLAILSSIQSTEEKLEGTASFLIGTKEYYIPVGDLINVEEELKKLETELKYNQDFLVAVSKKLSNEQFVKNAPEKVVELERKKQSDAEQKITTLSGQIAELKG